MGREMGGRFKREGTYVYLWLIHVEVWQKTTEFCKAIILQLTKQNKQTTHVRVKASFFSKPWSYFLVNPGLISLSLGFRLHSHNRVQPSGVCPEPDEWWGLCRACMSQAKPLPSAAHPQSQVRLVPGLLLPKHLPWQLPCMCACSVASVMSDSLQPHGL